jgi:hypothetical protein
MASRTTDTVLRLPKVPFFIGYGRPDRWEDRFGSNSGKTLSQSL